MASNGNLATAQVSVGTTPTPLAPARANRNRITIINHGTTAVFLGTAGVTGSNGVLLQPSPGASRDIDFTGALFGIVGAGT